MKTFPLCGHDRDELRLVVRSTSNADVVRRAQALLWLDEQQPVRTVAAELGVARQTIYNWCERFEARAPAPLPERLQDQPRTGRPSTQRAIVLEWLPQLLASNPPAYGFRARHWTAGALRCVIERRSHQPIGLATVRRGLRQLGHRYKRPRYVLARRDPHWRQAKGGSKPG